MKRLMLYAVGLLIAAGAHVNIDTTSANSGTGSALDSNPATPIFANEVISGAGTADSRMISAGTSFSSGQGSLGNLTEDNIRNSSPALQREHAAGSSTSSANWVAQVTTFRDTAKTLSDSDDIARHRPYIDVTAYGASGSSNVTKANCVRGVSSLTLASAIDFVQGEGLSILGCGPASTLSAPTIQVVNIGTAGSTTYSYGVTAVDSGGGSPGYGNTVSATTGNAALSGANYNAIYITPVAGATGYVLFGRFRGSIAALQYMPWEDPTSYTATASRTHKSVLVTIAGPTPTLSFFPGWFVTMSKCSDDSFNGTFQVGSTGQDTFAYPQSAANSTATGCTVTVNPTFYDFGVTYPFPQALTARATATNDIFVATITSLVGTTATLSAAPGANYVGALVRHDDTAPWQAAIAAAEATTNEAPLYCPAGSYLISSALNIRSGFTLKGPAYAWQKSSCTIMQTNIGADIFRAGGSGSVAGVEIDNVQFSGGRIGVDSVSPGGLSVFKSDGVAFSSYIGYRASANSIQVTMRNFLCQTQDWCLDSSPAATIQGLKMDVGWFSGVGFGVWHDVRIPNTFGYSSSVTFDNVLWEGPTASWMVCSPTVVGARMVFGAVAGLVINNGQLADAGSSCSSFIQNVPDPTGTPLSIIFNGGNFTTDTNAYLVSTLPTGTSNGIGSLIFNGGLFNGGAGIWGGSGPSPAVVINHGSTFSPALPTTNLVSAGNGGMTSSKYATATNCNSSASPAVCGSAAAGSVTIAASSSSVVVDTSAVTASSQITVTFDSSLGTKLRVACNTTAQQPYVSARTAGTSFTISVGSDFLTHPGCFSYSIVN